MGRRTVSPEPDTGHPTQDDGRRTHWRQPITDPRLAHAFPRGLPGFAALPPHCASNLPEHKTVNPVGRTRRGRARVRAMAAQQTTPSGARMPATALERAFERKVRLGKWALLFEQLWPRAWLILGLAGLFIGLSLAGLWPKLAEMPDQAACAVFGA